MVGCSAVGAGVVRGAIDPAVTIKVVDFMEDYCARHGINDINEIIGEI